MRLKNLLKTVALAAAAATAVVAAVHVVRTRSAIASVAPELRTLGLYIPYSFARPAMLPLARRLLARTTPVVDGVDARRITLSTGAVVVLYTPTQRADAGGALLWIHGGGHILGTVDEDNAVASRFALELGVPVGSVDYRIGPFPTDLDDCFTALRWLHDSAGELGIDPGRIAVGGASAGGGLAAALAQRATDEHLPVAFQLLEYPMLDDRTGLRPDPTGRGKLTWTAPLNRMAWGVYLAHRPGAPEDRQYAVPAKRNELAGLPPTWIGVGDLDLFHDEDLAYAERLRSAGVPCEVYVEPGMYHGADSALDVPSMRAFRGRMIKASRPHVSGGAA